MGISSGKKLKAENKNNFIKKNSLKETENLKSIKKNSEIIDSSNPNLDFSKKNNDDNVDEKREKSRTGSQSNSNKLEVGDLVEKPDLNCSDNNNSVVDSLRKNSSDAVSGVILLLNNDDFEREFNYLVIEEKLETNEQQKKLKKRLKKKKLRNLKKWNKMTKTEQDIYNQNKASMIKEKYNISIDLEEKSISNKDQINQQLKSDKNTKYNQDAFDESKGLKKDFKVKIADLGNGCWTHYHFQPEIQTRQYRGPEVILGINYNESADIWSFACMLFEMLTGDFLFDPRKTDDYKKNDDHLYKMINLLNEFPKEWSTIGTNSKRYFNKDGKLKKFNEYEFYSLKQLLMQKYKMIEVEAIALEDFLMPMLKVLPQERATAEQLVNHYWLDLKGSCLKNNLHELDQVYFNEDFNKNIHETDCDAEISHSMSDDEDSKEDDYLIEGNSYHLT
jgi:serine/threonine-protein kinase SRPK3